MLRTDQAAIFLKDTRRKSNNIVPRHHAHVRIAEDEETKQEIV